MSTPSPAPPIPTALQERFAALFEEAARSDLASVAATHPARLALLLAARFEYDVRKGGFAQLFYNLNGTLLAETEDMLIAAGAPVAHEYYVQAARVCLSDKPEYGRFMASEYTETNAVKDALHGVTLEYFAKNVPFALEAQGFLQRHAG